MQPEVFPRRFMFLLLGLGDPERRVLVGDDYRCVSARSGRKGGREGEQTVVFVLRVDGLVVRRHVDVVVRELVAAEVFEEVGDAAAGEVHVGSAGVLGLWRLAGARV